MPRGIYKHNPQCKETKEKISNTLKGRKFTEEHLNNIRIALKGKKKQFKKRKPMKLETKKKIGSSNKGKTKGIKHYNWQDGKSFEPYSIEFNNDLKEVIRNRDRRKCQICGKTELENKRILDVHLLDYNKLNCDLKNLISLCMTCHRKTNFKRKYWISYFSIIS